MNADHSDDLAAMIKHYCGVRVDSPKLLTLDRLGMDIQASHPAAGIFKLRLPFPSPAENRKGIKENIVAMTMAAAAAPSPAAP